MLKKVKAFHIEKIVIKWGKYINGLEITYKLDGSLKTVEHCGKAYNEGSEKVVLEEFEHLEYIHCTYSQQGVHSINFKTNTGRIVVCEGSARKGPMQRELNLREHNKAVIGWRGMVGSHLIDLYMYVGLRLDIITESG